MSALFSSRVVDSGTQPVLPLGSNNRYKSSSGNLG
ncbi:hypothetical protein A2U01_0116320, partial [Trifolium medium]|nr:hypothetical protein [Trifolium medium]